MNSAQHKSRLKEIDGLYRAKHHSAHKEFNTAFDRVLRKHGLTVTDALSVAEFPESFHSDPELVEAKLKLVESMKGHRENKNGEVRKLPRPKMQFTRSMRIG